MDNVVIQFRDVCFAYDQQEVLHNIDLSIPNKSLVGVVGPNGGGKTTLVKLTLGLLKPSRGTVKVFDEAPERRRHSIGYVPQHLSFDPEFPVSALDVVLMGRADRHWFGPYRRRDRIKAVEALERVNLAHLSHRSLAHLSGGERQRALIAQALVSDPELLILDEPTANVDTNVEHQIYELLHELNKQMTIVVVSHNLNVVTRHASHLACVNRSASLVRVDEITEGQLSAFHRGDMTVIQHAQDCHVHDASSVMCEPHHGKETRL
ncbi:ABC transporter ATP-binding protein [Shewanella algicola]|uniref:ABC transporter ATP-binding protein n=1 Tax=Shewanella algicola TaxID=640633 RepID=A0A9X2CCV4_9GAMM|nr:ABC transporter ATP-binding protein [Shewanella algicola]MCL1104786.1 ABC transporter ATP-binding protein [Shewanella algicola]GGP45675.1 ABC transporter ATP-binding protein [Shewanella algicola]